MKRLGKITASILLVFVSWAIGVYISFLLPGSPYTELPSIVADIQRTHQSSASITAFLKNAERANRYSETIAPILVALLTIAGLALLRAEWLEVTAGVVAYALLTIPLAGVCCFEVIEWNVIGVLVFAAVSGVGVFLVGAMRRRNGARVSASANSA